MLPPSPPYALATPAFRFRAIAAAAGRAPLGGAREIVLATYLLARLADDVRPVRGVSDNLRAPRAAAAKSWLASLTLPAAIRTSFSHLADATAENPEEVRKALEQVMVVTRDTLDAASRAELQALLVALSK